MAGKFEICKNAEEKFSFIMQINDETVAQSEFFDALDACKRGVKAAKKNARMKVENRFESDFEEKTLPKYVVEECDGKAKFTLYLQSGAVALFGTANDEKDALAKIELIANNAAAAQMVMAKEKEPTENELRQIRINKLDALKEAGKDPYEITVAKQTETSKSISENYDELDGKDVYICGRIMTWRDMGKANFIDVSDRDGKMQVYVRMNDIGEDEYKEFKKWDIGDIVEVFGFVFKTKTGEISVHAKAIKLISKSLLPLPEKFHGLQDTDTRYRKRYLDLIMNPSVKDTFIKRSKILSAIRKYLDGQGFMEVETPMLVSNAGGAAARPFETHFNALNEDFKLRISLELYLKRLIVGGMERVYEIGRVFRNEGLDTRHNPEFTLMELYQAYTDYNGMMDLTENLYRYVAQEVLGTTTISYNGIEMDLGKPFERITMVDAVKKYSGVDFNEIHSVEEAREAAKTHNIEFEEHHKKGDILNLFFEEFAEEHLIQPTFVMDHPIEISPLTKKKPSNPEYTERFEFFMNGWEMANAYSELNDPIDQRERFKAQEELLAKGDEEANTTDEDFLNALEIGMPPTGGIGFGIDRMCMLLTDSAAIRDVLLFPTMKSQGAAKNEANNAAQSTPVAAKVVVPVEETAAPAKVEIDFSNVEVEPLFEDMVDFDTFSKSDFRAVKVKECEAVPKSKKLLKFVLDDGSGVDRVILSGIHDYYEPEFLVGKTLLAITNLPPRKMMGIDSCGMIISATHLVEGREGLNVLILDDHIPAGAKLY